MPTRKKRFFIFLLAVTCTATTLYADDLNIPFIPPVYNYTTSHYRASNQNWAIAQGSDGVLYFGNDNGLLSFDGTNWQLHTLPNRLSVKSIHIDTIHVPERIYVGSFEEFGYFERDSTHQLAYHSLKNLASDYTFHNDEIWTIYPFKGSIYFQSFSAFFEYDGQRVNTTRPSPAVLYFFPFGDTLYAQLINSDFYRFDGSDFHQVVSREQLNDDNVVAVLPRGDDCLLVTSKSGLYLYSEQTSSLTKWRTPFDNDLESHSVNRALFTGDTYIFGTLNSGLFAMDVDGSMKWHVERHNGLNNNTVLALFLDREQNIWAALDNGISNIRVHSPLSFFEPTDIQVGLVEDILVHDNALYLATNQGIYHYSDNNKALARVPDFDIQSWFIKRFGDQVFVGHNQGTSLLQNNREVRVEGARTGGMDMKEGMIHGKNILLESSYTSLYIYLKNETGAWAFSHRVEGFSDLIKNIEIDHAGNIWADHMYKGVYRLRLDDELRNITESENYLSLDSIDKVHETPRNHPIRVMKLRGRLVLSDGSHFYTYDDLEQKIVPFELLNNDLPGFGDTHRIVPINDQLFWFIRNTEYALVSFNENRYTPIDRVAYSILNNPPNEGRANVYVTDNDVSFLCLNGGIGQYNFREQVEQPGSSLSIASIEIYDRKSDNTFYLETTKASTLSYKHNQVAFHFVYPEFSKKTFHVECILEGYDNRWIPANEQLAILYQNLPPGEYNLKARVVDSSRNELSSLAYSFRIKNPWYKTWWAYLSYILLLLLIAGLFNKAHIRRIVEKKNRLFEEQEKKRVAQIDRQEREITSLKNDRLEADLVYKGKQLASASMMIINHSEFLKGLRTTIQSQILNGKINRTEGNNLLNQINNNITDEAEWDRFQENFDLIHENFFRRLKAEYPSLTPTDLKLCSLLRLNYTTKEIAEMLNLSVRGVETARYRLRKKLGLTETDNLVNFMIEFK